MSSNKINLSLHRNMILPFHSKYQTNKLLRFLKKQKITHDIQRLDVSDIRKIYRKYGHDIFFAIYHQFFWISTDRRFINYFGIIVHPIDSETTMQLSAFINTLSIAHLLATNISSCINSCINWSGNVKLQSSLHASNEPKLELIWTETIEECTEYGMVINQKDLEKYILWYHPQTIQAIINKKGCYCCNSYHKGYKLCKQCKKAAYCSRKCQKRDWKHKHRQICHLKNK